MKTTPRSSAQSRSLRMELQIHEAPLAIASDGAVLVNLHHWDGAHDPQLLLDHAAKLGGAVFIGVVVSPEERGHALRQLDDAATSVAASVLARVVKQRRRHSPA